jgi:hypothetical protein
MVELGSNYDLNKYTEQDETKKFIDESNDKEKETEKVSH